MYYKFTWLKPRNLQYLQYKMKIKIGMDGVFNMHESNLQQYVAYGKEQGG